MNLNFNSIDAACSDGPNSPGVNQLYVIRHRDIDGLFPKVVVGDNGELDFANCDFDEQFVLKSLPTLKAGRKWAQYEFPHGTAMIGIDSSNDNGYNNYNQTIEFALAGFSRIVKAEMHKHLNAGAVIIVRLNGTQWVMVGASYSPVYLKINFTSGKVGKDKRGYTGKGGADGMMFPPLEISDALLADLAPNIEPLPES